MKGKTMEMYEVLVEMPAYILADSYEEAVASIEEDKGTVVNDVLELKSEDQNKALIIARVKIIDRLSDVRPGFDEMELWTARDEDFIEGLTPKEFFTEGYGNVRLKDSILSKLSYIEQCLLMLNKDGRKMKESALEKLSPEERKYLGFT